MTSSSSLRARIRGVLRSPRATFEALAAAPRSADALAVGFLAAFASTALVLETETGELALLDQLARNVSAFGERIDEAHYATLREISENGTAYALVNAIVSGPLLAVGLSAALVAVLRAPAGTTVTFRQLLAVISHAGIVLALRQVIGAPLIAIRETLASPLTVSMFFTLLDEGSPLARFAGMLDLFVIWWIGVLAIGVSVLYRRRAGPLVAVFAGVYLLLAALVASIAAIIV